VQKIAWVDVLFIVGITLVTLSLLASLNGCSTTSGAGSDELTRSRELLEREQEKNRELERRVGELEQTQRELEGVNREIQQQLDASRETIGRVQDTITGLDQLQGYMATKLRRTIEVLQKIIRILRGEE
jgi:uncharacterized protein YlxW (UPF0749 family)